MRFIRLRAREVNADQQEYLVYSVRDGVRGLGKHGGAAGECARDELAAGDREVRGHRGEDGATALLAAVFGRRRKVRLYGLGHSGD